MIFSILFFDDLGKYRITDSLYKPQLIRFLIVTVSQKYEISNISVKISSYTELFVTL